MDDPAAPTGDAADMPDAPDAATRADRAPEASEPSLAGIAPVSHAVFRVARLHKLLAGQLLREIGLYPNQELVMMRLWTAGPQRQIDLVRMLESDAPTVTRTIRRLEKAGFVNTAPSPTDKRSIIVEATRASMSLRSAVEEAWQTLEARTVARLPESRRAEVLDALATLETNLLEAESADGGP